MLWQTVPHASCKDCEIVECDEHAVSVTMQTADFFETLTDYAG